MTDLRQFRLADARIIGFKLDTYAPSGIYAPVYHVDDAVFEHFRVNGAVILARGVYDRHWFKSQVFSGMMIPLGIPVDAEAANVILCLPASVENTLSDLLPLQHLKVGNLIAAPLKLERSKEFFWRWVARMQTSEAKTAFDIFAMMLACEYLRDPASYAMLAATLRNNPLRDPSISSAAFERVKVFLQRFGRVPPPTFR